MTADEDQTWLRAALNLTVRSPDPNTRVGAVIVAPDGRVRSVGFNRLPFGILETPERLYVREIKLPLIIHAEEAAIIGAARTGVVVAGCTLYLAATDDSGQTWGGPPCVHCTAMALEAGIREIVSLPQKPGPSKWHADLAIARGLIKEAGILFREVAMAEVEHV